MVVTEELLGTSNNARFRAVSALAERAVAAARARVCPQLGTALMPGGEARSFAGSHTDSTLSAFKRAQPPRETPMPPLNRQLDPRSARAPQACRWPLPAVYAL